MIHQIDALVVGAGGAGLYGALELSKRGCNVAVLSKLYPTRSHTGTAQGGACAALGNVEEDHWEWHMFDTIKGGDYLVDQDAAEILCREAVETVYDLEHWGLPFSRTEDGRIAQRPFGGHTQEALSNRDRLLRRIEPDFENLLRSFELTDEPPEFILPALPFMPFMALETESICSAGASRRRVTPMPRGNRPSTAACTSLGARNASEIVILACRMLHCSRAAI